MEIRNKRRMYRDLHAGRLGNTVRSWNDWDDVVRSGYRGKISLRCMDVSNPTLLYHLPFESVQGEIKKLSPGQRRAGFQFVATPDDSLRTIQGELSRLAGGLYLLYSAAHLPMRLALRQESIHVTGLRALMLLRSNLAPVDVDELHELLDLYPGATIEFSGFSSPAGTIRGRCMVVWEVRNY